jgi:amidase
MDFNDYLHCDALELAARVRRREASALEVLDCAIAQMARVQPQINAICWEELDAARATARGLDAAAPGDAPFAGVPLLLKDLGLAARGMRMGHGSRLFGAPYADADSALAARLRQAGFNFLARTTTPELGANCTTEALAYGGPTRNPWDLSRSSGGSSGGAAAAVAAGIVPLAHASDGGGSIRIPASCCGLFGLKPSRMRNPMGPIAGEGWGGLGVEHVVTRSVRDSAAVLDATHGADPGAPYAAPAFAGRYLDAIARPPQRLRIGLITASPSGGAVHGDCLQAVHDAARLCESLGHQVEPAAWPEAIDYEAFGHAMRLIVATGSAQAVLAGCAARNIRPSLETLELSIFTAVDFALRHNAVDYADAIARMHRTGRLLGQMMQDRHDLLLTPTLTEPPAPLGRHAADRDYVTHRSETLRYTAFLPYFNASGQPAMNVPLHWNAENLPIGVQFAAPVGDEHVLLQLAAQLEAAQPWRQRLSPLAQAPLAPGG